MSYRPPEQELEGPCKKIIQGIDEFNAAANARADDGEWVQDHLDKLAEI